MAAPSDLDLLLARADGRPLLEGLGSDALAFTNRLALEEPEDPPHLGHDGDRNDMDQGWGVLYPKGREDLFEAIAPLRAWRQQGIDEAHARRAAIGKAPEVRAWAIDPHLTAREFLIRKYGDTAKQRPRYLLILGDLDGVSLEFQLGVSVEAYVGRLCLPSVDDYVTYARKLVASERDPITQPRPRLLAMSTSTAGVIDGAVDLGHRDMIEPIYYDFADPELELGLEEELVALVGPRGKGAADWPAVRELLRQAHPSVFLSLSHGLGDPAWGAEEQRERQGRMSLGRGRELDLDDVAKGSFLARGVWFNYACFGAGSPATSAFEPWLRRLAGAGVWSAVPDVLATTARAGPFVARQPQLALANPEGPLAIISHADLAFTYGFRRAAGQERVLGTRRGSRGRADHGPIRDVVQTLATGGRAGLALSKLRRSIDDADQALLAQWDRREAGDSALVRVLIDKAEAGSAVDHDPAARALLAATNAVIDQVGRGRVTLEAIAQQAGQSPREIFAILDRALGDDEKAAAAHMGLNWMAHHDLRGWIVLGDPAARVPTARYRGQAQPAPAPTPTPTPAPTPTPTPAAVSPASPELAQVEARLQARASAPLQLPKGVDLDTAQQAIVAYAYLVVMTDESSAGEVAEEYDLSVTELEIMYDAWVAAGRAIFG